MSEVSGERNKDCRNEGLLVYKKAVGEEKGRNGLKKEGKRETQNTENEMGVPLSLL